MKKKTFTLNFKPQFIRVNVSSTFPVRSKCKFCMRGPQFYYIQKMPTKWYSPHKIKEVFDFYKHGLKRISQDYYLHENPSDFISANSFNHAVFYKKYNPALHTKRDIMAVEDCLEFLACDCGRTSWSFVQKSSKYRKEIVNRKGKYKYSRKFEDWF